MSAAEATCLTRAANCKHVTMWTKLSKAGVMRCMLGQVQTQTAAWTYAL